MNLYEFEGKTIFEKHGIAIPKGILVRTAKEASQAYTELGFSEVVLKVQILSGKRGKNNGIRFCSTAEEVEEVAQELFSSTIHNQNVHSLLLEEKLDIAHEHYLSFTYDGKSKGPILIYSRNGGMDIEEGKSIQKPLIFQDEKFGFDKKIFEDSPGLTHIAQKLLNAFFEEDCRIIEINPLVQTHSGSWVAADAKIALDDDAFFRHEKWSELEARTMLGRDLTEREILVKKIDEGEQYYRGTAGKYIEMDGDIAILFSGGGASIANMDALLQVGLSPANYTEYSGNPPKEKVYELTKIVLSKPGLRGLWIAGGVANFTNIRDTFAGIAQAFDEIKPRYPIVVRRAGPYEKEGIEMLHECAKRNNLDIHIYGKEMSMGESAKVLADLVFSQ